MYHVLNHLSKIEAEGAGFTPPRRRTRIAVDDADDRAELPSSYKDAGLRPARHSPSIILLTRYARIAYRHSNAPRQITVPASLRISTSVSEPRSSNATESVSP